MFKSEKERGWEGEGEERDGLCGCRGASSESSFHCQAKSPRSLGPTLRTRARSDFITPGIGREFDVLRFSST